MAEQRAVERRATAFARSASRVACISFSTYGWQRIAPWPKMIRLRVRMFAPSTVIDTGICMVGARRGSSPGPMQMPLPPCDVHRVVDDPALALGEVVASRCRRCTDGLLAEVDRDARSACAPRPSCRGCRPCARAAPRCPRSFPIGVRNWRAHARVGRRSRARRASPCRRWTTGSEIAAARGEALHQHPPALARHRLAADDPVDRHEHVACPSSGRSGTPRSAACGAGRCARPACASG